MRAAAWLALALALPACTFVSQDAYDQKLKCLDEDGDTYVKDGDCTESHPGEDCDDNPETGATRNPGIDEINNEELWYDGIDNDCDDDRLDIIDQDGDNYPGIAEAEWVAKHGGLEWPDYLEDAVDCDDENASIYPGSSAEQPYDDIDHDCGKDIDPTEDDFDFDGDGHVPPPARLPSGSADYTGTLPQDDCDDTDVDTHPGTTVTDVEYDGIDHNCDGKNDFDKDGDTYMRTADQADFLSFTQKYDYTFPQNWDDCNDDDASIYPSASDSWYDGVDSNCDSRDDHDQDEDGYVPNNADLPIGSASYSGPLPAGDCNDTDALVAPGALELVGDSADQDCDGYPDLSAFGFSGYKWDMPRRPVVGATNHTYLVSVTADQFIDAAVKDDWGGTFSFTLDEATSAAEPGQEYCWEGCGLGYELGDALDMYTEGDRFYVTTSYQRQVTTPAGSVLKTYVRFHRYEWSTFVRGYTAAQPLFSPFETTDPYLDFDIEPDGNGNYIAMACGQNTVHYISAFNDVNEPNDKWTATGFASETFAAPDAGHACYVQPRTGDTPLAQVFDWQAGYGKSTYELLSVDIVTASDTSWSTMDAYDVNQRGGILTFAGGTDGPFGVTLDDGSSTYRFLDTEAVYSADAMYAPDGTLYIVAVVDDWGTDGQQDLLLVYGDPATSMTVQEVPFVHPSLTLEPSAASIYVDADRLLLGVSGLDTSGTGDDGVGWMFLGFPP